MYQKNLALLLLMISCSNGEMWTLPTALDIQKSLEFCQISNQSFINKPGVYNNETDSKKDIRCFAKELGLWKDEEGFVPKRIVRLLDKYQQPLEIVVVVNYCNSSHKQDDLDKWAHEAYYCFANGRIGLWFNEYIKNVYKKKIMKK